MLFGTVAAGVSSASILSGVAFRKRLDHNQPASTATVVTTTPTMMTKPKFDSSPKFPAAAIGPGVGGTKV